MVRLLFAAAALAMMFIMLRVISPALSGLFEVMNTSFSLTSLESATWQFMAIAVAIVATGCVIYSLVHRDERE